MVHCIHYLQFKNAAAIAEGHDYVTGKSDEGFTLPDSILTRSWKSVTKPDINKKYYEQSNNDQRWSRGHKARGQGQGHKKNPRPRTDTLEAKDRNARGQGQGPRTQA